MANPESTDKAKKGNNEEIDKANTPSSKLGNRLDETWKNWDSCSVSKALIYFIPIALYIPWAYRKCKGQPCCPPVKKCVSKTRCDPSPIQPMRNLQENDEELCSTLKGKKDYRRRERRSRSRKTPERRMDECKTPERRMDECRPMRNDREDSDRFDIESHRECRESVAPDRGRCPPRKEKSRRKSEMCEHFEDREQSRCRSGDARSTSMRMDESEFDRCDSRRPDERSSSKSRMTHDREDNSCYKYGGNTEEANHYKEPHQMDDWKSKDVCSDFKKKYQ